MDQILRQVQFWILLPFFLPRQSYWEETILKQLFTVIGINPVHHNVLKFVYAPYHTLIPSESFFNFLISLSTITCNAEAWITTVFFHAQCACVVPTLSANFPLYSKAIDYNPTKLPGWGGCMYGAATIYVSLSGDKTSLWKPCDCKKFILILHFGRIN